MSRVGTITALLAASVLMVDTALAGDEPGGLFVATPESELVATPSQAYSVLGDAVSIRSDRLLSGMPGLDADGLPERGGAAIFFRSDADQSSWVQETTLVSTAFVAGQQAGRAVVLGDGIAVLGSPDRSDAPGGGSPRVAVFRFDSGVWSETTPLSDGVVPPGSGFGSALDLDGSTLVVGAPRLDLDGMNAGGAVVWELDADGSPFAMERLTISSIAAGDRFGVAVAVDEDVIVVGAPGDDDAGIDAGAAWVFRREGVGWIVDAKLLPSVNDDGGVFGTAVSLDGDRMVVGAPRAGVDGVCEVFRRDPRSGWVSEAILPGTGPSETARDAGHAVAIDSGRIVVGQPAATIGGVRIGTAAVWRRNGFVWNLEGVIRPSSSGLILLGAAVSLDEGRLVAGMPLESSQASNAGGIATIDLDRDCDGDGVADQFATQGGLVDDCDADGVPDSCVLAESPELDCNDNGVLDSCDLASGDSEDLNLNGLLDECEPELVFEVPGNFPEIGDAIAAAPDGAVVEIATGVYLTQIEIGSTALTIRGSGDPFQPTVLRGVPAGLGAASVVRISGPMGSDCRLEDLVIEDGRNAAALPDDPGRTGGGGLLVIDADPVVERLIFRGCEADLGGAACLVRSSGRMTDCIFDGNTAAEAGGAVASIDGSILIEGGRFENNVAGEFGGGFAVRSGTATIDDVELRQNTAARGGGIHADAAPDEEPVSVVSAVIVENQADTRGGGIEAVLDGPGVQLTASLVCDNLIDEIAGPVFVDDASEVCQCASDLTGDGQTNGADLGLLLASFGSCDGFCLADIDGDGEVTGSDLGLILAGWGLCP
ncbi:MAG: hypothetical protein P8P71_00845 [Phycisphaerales bacterium]|nr:hypothetical protein [Phycisphaerales bacterium]